MFLCVSGISKEHLVHGALTEAEALTSPLPNVCAQFGLVWGISTLPTGVSTPLKCSRNVQMCHRNLQTKFGVWGFNRSWGIDLPSSMHLFNLDWFLGSGTLPAGVSHLPSSVKCSYVSQEPPKYIWCMGP